MDRLRYGGKFLAMGVVAALALGFLVFQVATERLQAIHRIEDERVGLRYLQAARPVWLAVQRHRGLSGALASGDQSVKDVVLQTQAEADKHFAALSELIRGEPLLADLAQDWQRQTEEWGLVKKDALVLGPGEGFERHTAFLQELAAHMRRAAAHTSLVLDGDLKAYLLIDVVVNQMPVFIEATAQLCGRATGVLARKRIDDAEATTLRGLMTQVRVAKSQLHEKIDAAVHLLGEEGKAVKEGVQALEEPVTNAFILVESVVLSQAFDTEPAKLFADTASPVDAGIRLTERLAVAAVLLFAYLCLGAYVSLARGVRAVVAGGSRLAGGDLTATVEVSSSDEIADIAGAFNAMAGRMREVLARVQDSARQVNTVANTLASATQNVANSSRKQSEAAGTVAAAVEEVTVSIHSVADNAAEVDKLSVASRSRTQEGNQSLAQMIGEIELVENAVSEIAKSVVEFVESTRAITDMTRQVKDIADQTNLLALNAAIEAARAGEQGRGFAVVADEVRKLAEKSAAAASQIDEVTRLLGTRTGGVEAVVGRGHAALKSCQEYLEKVTEILAEANRSVERTSAGMTEISASVREQTSASSEIARNVENIARLAEENHGAVDAAVREANRLKALAAELEQSASRFRV
jgi:methyl-accepting chemotaxis protein